MGVHTVLLLESVSEEAHRFLTENTRVLEADTPFTGGAIALREPIHAIVTRGKGDVSRTLIEQCPDLQVIARCGVGLDNVDVGFASRRGIKVVNAPGSNADTVAEHTLGFMLALQRDLYNAVAAVKNDQWGFRKTYAGDEIRGKTLGILGMGNIGKRVAKLAAAFGMQVVYWDQAPQVLPYRFLTLEALLGCADIISIHLPLTPETRYLINRDTLALMQHHALLINTARGGIVEQAALIRALETGQIGGFAADVLTVEPPPSDSPLLQMSNVLITPHAASLTARTYNEMCVLTVQNTLALLAGKMIEEWYIFNRRLI